MVSEAEELPGAEFYPVPENMSGMRFDACLAALLPGISRAKAQEMIRQGLVLLDGKVCKPKISVESGSGIVLLRRLEVEAYAAGPEAIPLDILFEDDQLLVINKPAGMVVHPAAGNWTGTLVNALLHHCNVLSATGAAALRPGIVHRLDKETSGCIVVAKTDAAHHALAAQFAERVTGKRYMALVEGKLKESSGTIDAPIHRHPVDRKKMTICADGKGRESVTDYSVVQEFEESSLVECTLHTGRTHQVRVHMKHLGHPLLGDKLYNPKKAAAYPRQMLHAFKLSFKHPLSLEMLEFTAPLPQDFEDAIRSQK